ncbi:MAG: exodeoxyribonuclease VII small subunit [Phycisphaera sp.]|nr:exodeoxyribonuclease VII small subunit [Phycisphaera sp.]
MTDAPSNAGSPPPVEELDFEKAAEELETIIDRLERGDVALEDSLEAYGRGQSLLARCRGILDSAAAKIAEVDLEAGTAGRAEDA